MNRYLLLVLVAFAYRLGVCAAIAAVRELSVTKTLAHERTANLHREVPTDSAPCKSTFAGICGKRILRDGRVALLVVDHAGEETAEKTTSTLADGLCLWWDYKAMKMWIYHTM